MEGKKKKYLIKSYKQMFLVIGIFTLVLLVGGTTFAFFNYTRTGSANTVKVGRIYFNHQEGNTISLENVFPISSEQAETDTVNAKTLSITVVGDTDYDKGIEYLLTLDSVNNTVNNKKVPINLEVSVTGEGLGTAETGDYYTNRESYTESKYKIEYNDRLEQDNHLLVDFISPNTTKGTIEGINGTINIKAYLDKDKVAISDTYPESEPSYQLNTNMTQEEMNACVEYVSNNYKRIGEETPESFCNGTGTIARKTFKEMIDNNLINTNQMNYFIENNIILHNDYSNGTTDDWVDGRIVLTTEEWNSLANTPLSFKVKVEANEGIWVQKPSKSIASCPDCKFMYYVADPDDESTWKWTTWNMGGYDETNDESYALTPTQITSGLYDNYEELIEATGKNYFLGVKLNSNNEVTNAYACGVKDNVPFCIEGTSDGSKYSANSSLINGANLWNNTCTVESSYTECGQWNNSGSLSAYAFSDGNGRVGVGNGYVACEVGPDGLFRCFES